MKLVFLALIPLILSIGITPALSFDFIPEADAIKSKGNSLTETGSKKVCGDKLCSEMDSKHHMKQSDMKTHSGSMDMHAMMERMDKIHEKHQKHMMKSWDSMTLEKQSQMYQKMQKMIEKMESMDMDEHMKMMSMMGEKDHDKKMHKDSGEKHKTEKQTTITSDKILFASTMDYTVTGPEIDSEKGYAVIEIGDGLYWVSDGMYQIMFLTTGEGVILVDAPMGMGEKIQQAISEVTSEKITHFIYSHIHKDHVGSASLLPKDTVYIAHSDTAEHLKMKNDPQRPIPTVTFDETYTLNVGDQTLELSYLGAFHSKGDIVIYSPAHKVIMAVDLFHPNAAPFQFMGITRDVGEHLAVHDKLLAMDWEIMVSGHEPILGTPEHLKFNKEFTLAVLDNAITAMQTTLPSPTYFTDVPQACAELTLEQFPDLKDIEVYPVENCVTMVFYAMID